MGNALQSIFNCTEFDIIKNAAGSNNFVFSVEVYGFKE